MSKTCPCCGQTLPPALPDDLRLSPDQRRIVERIRRAGKWGVSADVLFDHLYASREDGGPMTGRAVMHVQIYQINKTLKPHNKAVRGDRAGAPDGSTNYVLKDL